MKKTFIVSLLAVAFLFTGCATMMQVDRGTVQTVANLDKSQYDIVGNVEGNASVTMVFFFFPIGAKPNSGKFFNPYASLTPWSTHQSPVEGMAIYNAIESQPNVDMVIAPRYETTVKGFPPFFWTTTVKVKGTGIDIK